MSLLGRLGNGLKAGRELGLTPLLQVALYGLGVSSGVIRWQLKQRLAEEQKSPVYALNPVCTLPPASLVKSIMGEQSVHSLFNEADEIAIGQVRLFGGERVSLDLAGEAGSKDWTVYSTASSQQYPSDIRIVWEHARCTWAIKLAWAYYLSGEEAYVEAFWRHTETFLDSNPPYRGVHWVSAQESAIRLISLVVAGQIFAPSTASTPARQERLSRTVAVHALRIPPTLLYARAQKNNHLLSEAAALMTAGLALPGHPKAQHWYRLGWRWFQHGLETQIADNGTYIQHSTNYHRLMLQLALWVRILLQHQQQDYPSRLAACLHAATTWLLGLADAESGKLPNLGPNDSATLFSLSGDMAQDERPTLQAAARAFTGERAFQPGAWDALSVWLGCPLDDRSKPAHGLPHHPQVLRSPDGRSWAYLRAAHFTSRPGHADQLHLDLWWRGLNLAQDAGTYLYNGTPPWENGLAGTDVHNTVMINNRHQMRPAGRFLWLDWAQACLLSHQKDEAAVWQHITAEHDGYTRQGVIHRRSVECTPQGNWLVTDELLPTRKRSREPLRSVIHWLVPDVPWQVVEEQSFSVEIALETAKGSVGLKIYSPAEDIQAGSIPFQLSIARAGASVYGTQPVRPTWGWVSTTYGSKQPALGIRVVVEHRLPFRMFSSWKFPQQPSENG